MQCNRARNRFRLNALCRALIAAIAVGSATAAYAQQEQMQQQAPTQTSVAQLSKPDASRHNFDIPRQSAATGLNEFARQADITLVFSSKLVSDTTINAVEGNYAVSDALRLLLEGTPLSYQQVSDSTVAISRKADTSGSTRNQSQLAQVTTPPPEGGDRGEAKDPSVTSPEVTEMPTMVVTGTHLRGGNPNTAPIISYGRDDIERGGYTTVQDLLSRLPQNFSGNTPSSQAFVGGNVGFSTQIDLRGLGPESTLTLVNGRRAASAAGDQARAFDISIIPVTAIERVDVLTSGASALYGSDAIAGVVNIVLRRDLNGAESSLQYGANEFDGNTLLASQLFGRSWATGQFMLAAQYDRRDAIPGKELGRTTTDLRALGGGDFRFPGLGSPGTVYPASIFDPEGGPFTSFTAPDGSPVFFAALPDGNGRNLNVNQLAFNELTFLDSVPPDVVPAQENLSAYVTAEQTLGPVTLFVDGVFAKRKTFAHQAADADYLYVPTSNAYSPFDEDVVVGYQFNEFAAGDAAAESEGWISNIGGRGNFGSSSWTWELVGTLSRDRFETRSMTFNTADLAAALESSDPDVAFNPFGDGSDQSPGVIDALRERRSFIGTSDLNGISALTQGQLLAVPAGALELAVGAEYRDEKMATRVVRENRPDNVQFPDAGRDVRAIFAELNLPVFAAANARPGLHELLFNVAARYERYSDFGETTNPRVGLSWGATDQLAVKASWGTSFRAPSLRELFAAETPVPGIAVFDPRAPGGPAYVFATVNFGGNPELQEEEADNLWIAAEYRPSWLKDSYISIGYYETDYRNRIRGAADGLSPDFLLAIEDSLPTGIVERDANGNLTRVNLGNINTAKTRISGYDITAGYGWDAGAIGRFDISASANINKEFADQLAPGSAILELQGTVGNAPKWRGQLGLVWSRNSWTANATVNYIDELRNIDPDPTIVRRDVDAQTIVDLQVGYNVNDAASALLHGLSVRVGVQNLFGERAPFVDGRGLGFDARNHEIAGRTVYVRLTKTFGAGR